MYNLFKNKIYFKLLIIPIKKKQKKILNLFIV